MMSGIDSIYHSLTYQAFNSRTNGVKYLSENLTSFGYNIYFITFFPEGFHALPPIFNNLTSDLSSKSPPKHRFWSNKEITEVLNDLIAQGLVKEPFFFYLNYNCRNDPDTSSEVEKGLQIIESNFSKDNTYLLINSDHGYPDPSKKLQNQLLLAGHDIVMSEDNITVPLAISGPDLQPGSIIKNRTSLIELSEFIESIASSDLKSSYLFKLSQGQDLDEKVYFTWNRYPAQFGGLLAICYKQIKAIYSLDTCEVNWYQILSNADNDGLWNVSEAEITDPDVNKLEKQLILSALDNELTSVIDFHADQLCTTLKTQLLQYSQLIIIGYFTPFYLQILGKMAENSGFSFAHNKLNYRKLTQIALAKREPSSSIRKKSFFIFIPSGVSPVAFTIDMFSLFKSRLFPDKVCDFDFKRQYIPLIYFIRLNLSSLRQIKKSISSRGLRLTISVLSNAINRKR